MDEGHGMIKAYIDGAMNPKTKKAGVGLVLLKDAQQEQLKAPVIPAVDNHYTEFQALAFLLDYLKEKGYQNEFIFCYSDSQVLVEAVERGYLKRKNYQVILRKVLEELAFFPHFYLSWLADQHNLGADQLAKQALQMSYFSPQN